MLIRIVKMTFRPEEVENFLRLFKERRERIAGFEGCNGVDLLRDKNNACIFFTYSRWMGEEYLERYRNSELFNDTWTLTKKLFADKPEAWSTQEIKF